MESGAYENESKINDIMRLKFLALVTFFALAVLFFIFWSRPAQRVPNQAIPMPDESLKTNQVISKANIATQNSNVAVAQNAIISLQSSQAQIAQPIVTNFLNNDDRISKVIRKFNSEHNAPVEFYAEVVDLNTNPIPSVKVNVSIYQTTVTPSQNPEDPKDIGVSNSIVRLQEETGLYGRFEITGENGYGIDIDSIQKNGYELSPDTHRSYKSISGSIENPIIIKLRKTSD